jgi:hypothetical protein
VYGYPRRQSMAEAVAVVTVVSFARRSASEEAEPAA